LSNVFDVSLFTCYFIEYTFHSLIYYFRITQQNPIHIFTLIYLPLDYSISSGHLANEYARLYLDNMEYTMKAINSIHNVGNWRTQSTQTMLFKLFYWF